MPSDDRFSPPGIVSEGDIFEAFTEKGEDVLNTTEIDNHIDHASYSTVRRKLEDMRDKGVLGSKKGGEAKNSGEVWYLEEEIHEIPQPTPEVAKLIYRYPALFLLLGGLITLGISFVFYLMGISGEKVLFGTFDSHWMRVISLILFLIGIAMGYLGGSVYIWASVKDLIYGE